MDMITKISRNIWIKTILGLGAFLLIACMVFYPTINGLLLRFDVISVRSTEDPIEDPCFVAKNHALPGGLHCVLRRAAMEDSTVIITIFNHAWAKPGSLLDLFFESFRIGEGIHHLLKHLVIIAVDSKAYQRCMEMHSHCYFWTIKGKDFSNENKFLSHSYLDLNWGRIVLLRTILELGYNFIYTDADIIWLRDPFPHLRKNANVDLVMSSDYYFGNPNSLNNSANVGFAYVKSNNRTTLFFRYWHGMRDLFSHPGEIMQDAFNKIKGDRYVRELGATFYFLDTKVFSNFCDQGKDMSVACTMHATCCASGLKNKVYDLSLALDDWRNFTSTASRGGDTGAVTWSVPKHCLSFE